MESIRQVKDGVVIEVKASPGAESTILYRRGDTLILDISSQPEKNKANMEAVKYLSKLLNREAVLVGPQKSRKKVFLIKNASQKDVEKVIQ